MIGKSGIIAERLIRESLDRLVDDDKIKFVKRWEYSYEDKKMKWIKYYSMVKNK